VEGKVYRVWLGLVWSGLVWFGVLESPNPCELEGRLVMLLAWVVV
jgi:hypothetical protein